MEYSYPNIRYEWKPDRKYFHVGTSPVAWDTADPLAPATLDGRRRESPRINRALHDYCELGSDRSLENLVRQYASESLAPTRSLNTLKKWSAVWNWGDRVDTFDAASLQSARVAFKERMDEALKTGIALNHERVEKLKAIYSRLEACLDDPDFLFSKQVKNVPGPDGASQLVETRRFNAGAVVQLRGLLNDLARETRDVPPPMPLNAQPDLMDLKRLNRVERDALISLLKKAEGLPLDPLDTIVLGLNDPETE